MKIFGRFEKFLRKNSLETDEGIRIICDRVSRDAEDRNRERCKEDMRELCAYLNGSDIDEGSENTLAAVTAQLSGLQSVDWFRDMFYDFISFLEKDFYFSTYKIRTIVDAAYASNESYRLSEDKKADPLLKAAFPEIADDYYAGLLSDKEESPEDSGSISAEEDKEAVLDGKLEREADVLRWFVIRYKIGREEQLSYIEKSYPHLYSVMSSEFNNPPGEAEDKILTGLAAAYRQSRSMVAGTLTKGLYQNLKKLFPERTEELSEEEELWENVKSNDPCPCGSGKKYKKCHGRA